MAKNQEKKFGLAFDSGLKLIYDAPGKKSPIHLWIEVDVPLLCYFVDNQMSYELLLLF